jgi:hypothetical protein
MILRRLGLAHDPVENMLVREVENTLELSQPILIEAVQVRFTEGPH